MYCLKVILGGGQKQFLPTKKKNSVKGGLRNDERNLIDEWLVERSKIGKSVFVDDRVKPPNLDFTEHIKMYLSFFRKACSM